LALSKQKKVRLSKSEPVWKPRSVLLKHEKARRRTLFETENHPSVYLSKPKSCPFESRENATSAKHRLFQKPKITLPKGSFCTNSAVFETENYLFCNSEHNALQNCKLSKT
jgi:hypothetical protein